MEASYCELRWLFALYLRMEPNAYLFDEVAFTSVEYSRWLLGILS